MWDISHYRKTKLRPTHVTTVQIPSDRCQNIVPKRSIQAPLKGPQQDPSSSGMEKWMQLLLNFTKDSTLSFSREKRKWENATIEDANNSPFVQHQW